MSRKGSESASSYETGYKIPPMRIAVVAAGLLRVRDDREGDIMIAAVHKKIRIYLNGAD